MFIFWLVTSGDMSADLPGSFSLSKYLPFKEGGGGKLTLEIPVWLQRK